MKYKRFGKSGLRVSDTALGTMTFGEDWGWGAPNEESARIFDTYAEAGGNFIDTASSYTGGTSENLVGEFVARDRDRFVVATKYTHFLREGDPNSGGNHRKSLRQSLEQSLKRLKTDYIDLLWVHNWDRITPLEEILRVLDDAVTRGEVLYIGLSDAPAWVASRADVIAEVRGWTAFAGVQLELSLISRHAERDLLPMADHLDLGVTAWGPLGAGVLTGKYLGDADAVDNKRIDSAEALYGGLLNERNERIARAVREIADEAEVSTARVALAWLCHHHGHVIPILGARTVDQFRDNLAARELNLTDAELDKLNAISAIERGFPHDFLDSDPVRYMTYAGDLTHNDFS